MGGCDVFKEKGFIIKFCICLVCVVLIILYALSDGMFCGDVTTFAFCFFVACLYFFIPYFIMMIMYGVKSFDDHKYELAVGITGAICALLACVLCIAGRESGGRGRRYYHGGGVGDVGGSGSFNGIGSGSFGSGGASGSGSFGGVSVGGSIASRSRSYPTNLIVTFIFELVLCALFILDAVMNGAQKC